MPVCPELVGLAGPFTRIARAMSSEWAVRIVPSGARCETDGEVIRIPFTADYLPEDRRQELHGLLDHEVCHVAEERRHRKASRATPMEILKKEKDKRVRLLVNVVEDVRIESRYSSQYIGVAQNLATINLKAASDWAEMAMSGGARPGWWKIFGAALILRAHGNEAEWAEVEFGDYLHACADEIELMRAGVGDWVDASLDVATRIFEKVKHVHEQSAGKGGDGGDGKNDDKKDGLSGGGSPSDEALSDDMLEELRAGVEDYVIHDAKEHGRYIPHPKSQALDEVEESEEDMAVYASARAEVLPQIHALRQKQRALISTWSRRRPRAGQTRGEIDEGALSDVRVGATDVFSELTRKRLLDTAITGLVDCSGSMGINRVSVYGAYYALRTAIALADSWSALGVANEWLGYTVRDDVLAGITADDVAGPFFCRPPLHHLIFKGFDEPIRAARARFGGIQGRGSNVDGESVLWAWQRLIVRPEQRKILVVISDGRPATWNNCPDEDVRASADEAVMQAHLREAIRKVTKSGVEVIGFGAGTSVPSAYYNEDTGAKFVYVANLSTLAMDVFKVMKKRVTDLA